MNALDWPRDFRSDATRWVLDGRQPFRYAPERPTTGKVRVARYSSTIEDAGQRHLCDCRSFPVCLPALLLRYPMRELDPPGRRRDIAAQQTGGNKKSDSDVKRTIHAARHGQLDQPQDKNDRDRRSPESRKKSGMTGSKK
jgi:hypothetical protein